MAVFDGLVNWWGFGDTANALVDGGSFAVASALTFPIADSIAAYGLPPHDGVYTMGAQFYSPSGDEKEGTAQAADPAPWQCDIDVAGMSQSIPGPEFVPIIDPQVGHFGNGLGAVDIPDAGLWFDPREGWTIAIWALNAGGYYIKRQSTVKRQYLMGDHIDTPTVSRGWYIVADLDTQAVVPTQFTSDGLHTAITEEYAGAGAYKFVMNNGVANFSISFGPTDTAYSLLVLTYDGVNLKTYQPLLSSGPWATRPTTTGEIVSGGTAYTFGGRNNLGADDNGYTAPWNGAWDEALQWSRALSAEEIGQLPTACDSHIKIKSRYFARNAEGNNRFARAAVIRGASGSTVPRDAAGNSVEEAEPKGANLKRGLHQTMWYKWTAPSSGSYTFHTGDGSPADLYSTAPLTVEADATNNPDPVPHPDNSLETPAISGTYLSPPPGGTVFPPYPRQVGHGLQMYTENGDDWIERNPDSRIPGAGRTLIDWPSSAWTQIAFAFTENLYRLPSFGSDQTIYQPGRNPAYLDSVPQEDPEFLGPDHTDDSGPAATFPHWFTDVFPPAGHVWDTGWVDPGHLDSDYPHITSDGGMSFDTLEEGIWQLSSILNFPSTNPQGDTTEDQNHPYADVIGINYPHWKDKLFRVRLRETVTDTVIAFHELHGWEMQLNSGYVNVTGGDPPGVSDKDFSYLGVGASRIPSGRNFVVEVWQNTGSTLHTEVGGSIWMAKIPDSTYPYPQLP